MQNQKVGEIAWDKRGKVGQLTEANRLVTIKNSQIFASLYLLAA
jgi:hypothetical protein